jgi:hypothetical protein
MLQQKGQKNCPMTAWQLLLIFIIVITSGKMALTFIKQGNVERFKRGWKARGSNPGKSRRYSLLQNRPDRPWDPHRLIFSGIRCSFLGTKRPRHEASHALLCTAEVSIEWNCTSLHHYAFAPWTEEILHFTQHTVTYMNQFQHEY